jgi:hypothetical protein
MFRLYAGYGNEEVGNDTFIGTFESIHAAKQYLYTQWCPDATKHILRSYRLGLCNIGHLCDWARVQSVEGRFFHLKASIEDLVIYNGINPDCFFADLEAVDKTKLKHRLVFAKIMNFDNINSEDTVIRLVGDFDTEEEAEKYIMDNYPHDVPLRESVVQLAMYDNRPRKEPFTN